MTEQEVKNFNSFIDEGLASNQTYSITHLHRSDSNNSYELRIIRYDFKGEPWKSELTDKTKYFLFEIPGTL